MNPIKSAIARLKQRSKLPSGDRIVQVKCLICKTVTLYWNDDPNIYKLCKYCGTKP